MSEGDNNRSVYIYNGVGVPDDVTHVRVDQSVTVIPRRAFEDCGMLEVVELPEGLIRVEKNAFQNCTSLRSINFPSTLEEIGEQAFENCRSLEHIKLPEGLQTLGGEAFKWCKSLQRINIPPNTKVVEEAAFLFCYSLTSVTFSEGIQEIGEDSFSRCTSLISVTLPSSLKVIGEQAFEHCTVLNEVHMHDTIESIETEAFRYCNFTNFRMPPLLTKVDISIVERNSCFVSLELPETVTKVHHTGNYASSSADALEVLRNIALPSECALELDTDTFHNSTELEIAYPDADIDTMREALQHRFDELPIHKICYYQSYHDTETTMQSLKREIKPWTSKPPGQLNTTCKEKDCLGMTPLHILACSTKPTIEMFRLLIEKYPETLIMKDKWGDIPLLYALWCDAPVEVLTLLVESYKSNYPEFVFDWKDMILTIAKRNVPLANIKRLVKTQQSSFQNQEYDMQDIVMELAESNATRARSNKLYTSIETFRYLLGVSISKRLGTLDVPTWREELETGINDISNVGSFRVRDTQAVYDRLTTYESIKEATSVLELALWKAKIDESRSKRAKVDEDVSYKEQCRVNSGADIIIRNVLPYVIPDENILPPVEFTIDSSDESSEDSSDSDDSNEEED